MYSYNLLKNINALKIINKHNKLNKHKQNYKKYKHQTGIKTLCTLALTNA